MSLARFDPTPDKVVRVMLELAELKPGETLYDLGCGDGRIVITAAQEFGAKAVGVELDGGRHSKCVKRIHELQIENQVSIIHDDLLKVDLSKADVVTLYLSVSANGKVKPNLEHYLRKGARVVSHDWRIPGWNPARIQKFRETWWRGSHTFYLYRR